MSASDFLSGAITKRYLATAAPSEYLLGAKSGKKKGASAICPTKPGPGTLNCDTVTTKCCIIMATLDADCMKRRRGGKKKPGKKSPARKKTPAKRTPRSR